MNRVPVNTPSLIHRIFFSLGANLSHSPRTPEVKCGRPGMPEAAGLLCHICLPLRLREAGDV